MGVRSSSHLGKRDQMRSKLQGSQAGESVSTETNLFRSETEQEEYTQYKMEARKSVHAHKKISRAMGRRGTACGFCCCGTRS